MTSKSTCSKNKENKKFNSLNSIVKKLQHISFNKLAVRSGFKQRKERKIKGKDLLIGFILMSLHGRNTYQYWAEQVSLITGKMISKQAIWKKVTPLLTNFLSAVLQESLGKQIALDKSKFGGSSALKNYKRILLQDSTVLALPIWLSRYFPGNVSRGQQKAQLKIQVVYDLLSCRFVHFEITSFTSNDQSKARDILSLATNEDLVIRDLGYFVLECFEELSKRGIHFISRMRYGVKIYDLISGEELNLLKEIKKKKSFDQWVLIGRKKKSKVRLIAIPLTSDQANARRRKARHDRDQRLNHNQEYFKLLSYKIFITTEDKQTLTATEVAQTYCLRWRIESIFKCWKSCFQLQNLIYQTQSLTNVIVLAIVYMTLIFILLFQVTICNGILNKLRKGMQYVLSLVRICQYISAHINILLHYNFKDIIPLIIYNCRYDNRKDRLNFNEKMSLLS